jgi:hypothetical protein
MPNSSVSTTDIQYGCLTADSLMAMAEILANIRQ